jgi:hypothetical protein
MRETTDLRCRVAENPFRPSDGPRSRSPSQFGPYFNQSKLTLLRIGATFKIASIFGQGALDAGLPCVFSRPR